MQEVTEGKVTVKVPVQKVVSKDLPVFFNPKMELNRSLSIAVLATWEKDALQIALPLAGSGVRGVRMLKELAETKIKLLDMNDHSDEAFAAMQENSKRNTADSRLSLSQKEATTFLENSQGYDYIDIDPFGSPNPLLDVACRRLARGGLLAVTATDTGALAGSFIDAGRMKYWAENKNTLQKHELGLRILARKVMLVAMQHAKALTPILSYHHEHYYRIFFRCEKGKQKAAALYPQTTATHFVCENCGNQGAFQSLCPYCQYPQQPLGPLYSGQLQDEHFCSRLVEEFPDFQDLLQPLLQDDALKQTGFFDTHELCKHSKLPLCKISELVSRLEAKGFVATQSGFERTGCKTNAKIKDILNCLQQKPETQ